MGEKMAKEKKRHTWFFFVRRRKFLSPMLTKPASCVRASVTFFLVVVGGLIFPAQVCWCSAPNAFSTENSVLVVRVGFWNPQESARKETWPLCSEACAFGVLWTDKASVNRVLAESSGHVFGLSEAESVVMSVGIPVGVYTGPCLPTGLWYTLALAQVDSVGVDWRRFPVRMWVYPSAAGGGACDRSVYSSSGSGEDLWFRHFNVPTVVHGLGLLLGMPQCAADASDPMCNVVQWNMGTPQLFPAARRLSVGWHVGLHQRSIDLTSPVPLVLVLMSPDDVVVGVVPSSMGGGKIVVQWRSSSVFTTDVWMQDADSVFLHWLQPSGSVVLLARLAQGQSVSRLFGSAVIGLTVSRISTAWGDGSVVEFGPCQPYAPTVHAFPKDRSMSLQNNDVHCSPRTFVATAVGAPMFSCVNVTVVTVPDANPREMSFHIVDGAGGILLRHVQTFLKADVVTLLHCSEFAQEVLTVVFVDRGGDGFCCDWGQGSFAVWANGYLVTQGGKFGKETSVSVVSAWQW